MSSNLTQDILDGRYIDVDGAAKFFCTSKGAIYNWVWRGKLFPLRPFGKKLLFRRTDLERLVETSNQGGNK